MGSVNLLGTLMLLAALSENVADGLLRRWTQIIKPDVPFRDGAYGRIWLWWAIIGTGFFGAINLIATRWPLEYARWIAFGDVYAYGSFELLAIAASISRRYGRGITVSHFLWIAQTGWGIFTVV